MLPTAVTIPFPAVYLAFTEILRRASMVGWTKPTLDSLPIYCHRSCEDGTLSVSEITGSVNLQQQQQQRQPPVTCRAIVEIHSSYSHTCWCESFSMHRRAFLFQCRHRFFSSQDPVKTYQTFNVIHVFSISTSQFIKF